MDSPYYETDAEKGSVTDSMREAFAKAVQTQKEAETTFGEVSNLLAETKGIGLEHELWKEWDSLRQVGFVYFHFHIPSSVSQMCL